MTTQNELTKQERSVLSLVATGRQNSKIASELCISTRTVENHLYHIFDKLGVCSRTEAALYAMRAGFLPSSEMSRTPHDTQDNNAYAYAHK